MDIRNIKEWPKPSEHVLLQIWVKQKELLELYKSIEGLPEYPVDINSKTNQILLKDFSARVVEELGEAMESYYKADRMLIDSKPHGMNKLQFSEWVNHIQNYNEELSDALHFLMELIIVSGVYKEPTNLPNIEKLAHIFGQDSGWYGPDKPGGGAFDLPLVYDGEGGYGFPTKDADINTQGFLRGKPRKIINFTKSLEIYMWNVTYELQIARNCLKNKPWKQTGVLTDNNSYNEHLKNALMAFLVLLCFTGHNPNTIWEIYYKKNMVNQFRIKSKY